MTKIFVVPKPGVLVRHPETGRAIPAKGESVERSTYWLRRIKAGDVVVQGSEVRNQESEKPTDIPAASESPPTLERGRPARKKPQEAGETPALHSI